MVDPMQPEHIERQSKNNKFQVTVKEYEEASGTTLYYERYEAIIPISSFDHAKKYKIACEACHTFGKNFSCPPYSPYFLEFLDAQNYAKVLCISMSQEYFRDVIQEKIYVECFRKARSILVEELLSYRKQGYLVAGVGFCLACDVCAVEEGSDNCKKPDEKIYSLESLGVNLTALIKQCFGFDLEWSVNNHTADFVCSVGAIFMNENKKID